MTVSTIATIAAGLTRALSNPSNKTSEVLKSFDTTSSQTARADVADLSVAITLQNQVAQFRVASKDVAQAGSLLSAAEAGAKEIATNLGKLKDLATQAASTTTSDSERIVLNQQFQAIRAQNDAIAKNTKFNGESLLDGSSAQLKVQGNASDAANLTVSSLTDSSIFADPRVEILNPSGAKITIEVLGKAINYVNEQISKIDQLQQGLDFASATLQSAIQNTDATNSTLNDADLVQALLTGTNGKESNGVNSLFAQTNRLPTNLLQLLSE